MLLCALLATTIYANDTPNVQVRIISGIGKTASPTTVGTYKIYASDVYSSSTNSLYFNAQQSSGNTFVIDSYRLIAPNPNQTVLFDNQITNIAPKSVLWRLQLNAYGLSRM